MKIKIAATLEWENADEAKRNAHQFEQMREKLSEKLTDLDKLQWLHNIVNDQMHRREFKETAKIYILHIAMSALNQTLDTPDPSWN